MSSFYTNVTRRGNFIYYVGYEDGRRVVTKEKYEPTLYIPTSHDTDLQTLMGTPVKAVKPGTMADCRRFIEQHDSYNSRVFGNTDYIAQYISDHFLDGCQFRPEHVNIGYIDIEVHSEEGFPKPEQAFWPVTAITVYSSKDGKHHTFGDKHCEPEGDNVIYYSCGSEKALLEHFMDFWEYFNFDVITGWNSKNFDIPYLVNRCRRLFGEAFVKRLSPHYLEPDEINDKFDGLYFNIPGISHLDYMLLYKKFGVTIFGTPESFKLDHIAHIMLGEKKLDYSEYGSLKNLYHDNYQLYIDYNIKDVGLIKRLEEKLGFIFLGLTLAHKANVNYETVFGSTKIWDTFIYNVLRQMNVVVMPQDHRAGHSIAGGYVKEPIKGMSKWVSSFDLNSLYPHLIMQYNMSPETIVDMVMPGVNPDVILTEKKFDIPDGYCMTASGQMFRTDRQGVFPQIVQKLYDERKIVKREMLDAEQELEDLGKGSSAKHKELEDMIARKNGVQHAIKIMMNSLYGAMTNQHFRYYDVRIGEAITLTGQATIRWAEKYTNQYLNNLFKYSGPCEKDFVIAIDTDSIYVCLDELVQRVMKDETDQGKICDFLDNVGKQKLEPVLDRAYDKLYKYMRAFDQKMVMKREVIATAVLFTGKKRYIANVLDDEGVRLSKPKMKIVGIESVRSSTPEVCRTMIEETLELIMNKDEATVQDYITGARKKFKSLRPEEVAFPRGVKNMEKYMSHGNYMKGTPIHVRASILYNNEIVNKKIDNDYEKIYNGNKIKFTYLKVPNVLGENVIGFPDVLPKELNLHEFVDYDTQFEKAYLSPIRHILAPMGWNEEKINTLEDFF